MDEHLGFRVELLSQFNLLWLDMVVNIAEARIEDYPLFALGRDIMPQVLVGHKEDFISRR